MGQNASQYSPDDSLSCINRRKFHEIYGLGKEIGIGSFATVNMCYNKDTLQEYAVKTIDKRYLSEKELLGLRDEIQILRRTDNEHIIKLYDVFDDGKTVKMVLEKCKKQDLFDEIVESKHHRFSEERASQITYNLSEAIRYLHSKGIVHRDLKPENILFKRGILKLTDFGLAHNHHFKLKQQSQSSIDTDADGDINIDIDEENYIHPEEISMSTCCGTPHYVAPEIVSNQKYGPKCDYWSLGVVLFIMLVGYQPFNADSLNQIYKQIVRGNYSFNDKRWDKISSDAKDLITHLLNIDPVKRYNYDKIKNHPFIKKYRSDLYLDIRLD